MFIAFLFLSTTHCDYKLIILFVRFGGNADVAAFWEAMTLNTTEDEQPDSEAELSDIMNLWTTENGYPVVTVTRNYETGSAVIHQVPYSSYYIKIIRNTSLTSLSSVGN